MLVTLLNSSDKIDEIKLSRECTLFLVKMFLNKAISSFNC